MSRLENHFATRVITHSPAHGPSRAPISRHPHHHHLHYRHINTHHITTAAAATTSRIVLLRNPVDPSGAAVAVAVAACCRCGESVIVIACSDDHVVIDRILARLRETEKEAPARPLLVPPTRAPPATLSLFAGTEFHQQGRH